MQRVILLSVHCIVQSGYCFCFCFLHEEVWVSNEEEGNHRRLVPTENNAIYFTQLTFIGSDYWAEQNCVLLWNWHCNRHKRENYFSLTSTASFEVHTTNTFTHWSSNRSILCVNLWKWHAVALINDTEMLSIQKKVTQHVDSDTEQSICFGYYDWWRTECSHYRTMRSETGHWMCAE